MSSNDRYHRPTGATRRRAAAGFTLTELLVAMTVVVILAIVTIVSFRSVFLEARLSSASNTVSASLAQARALAVRDGRAVLVAFVPRRDTPRRQRTDIYVAQWTGETRLAGVDRGDGVFDELFDRFRPVPDRKIRSLPGGINVAGPLYANHVDDDFIDDAWTVPTNPIRPEDEAPGRMVGVMFAPDGSITTHNPASQAEHVWIDFDNSEDQNIDAIAVGGANGCLTAPLIDWYEQRVIQDGGEFSFDETNIHLVPFLAIFNEREARELYNDNEWDVPDQRRQQLSEYINEFADRLHFNRYTGAVMQ